MSLAACGTMGIGTNHRVNVHNDSDQTITATGGHGTVKIDPGKSKEIRGDKPIQLTSKSCATQTIDTSTNIAALALDFIPGVFFGLIPFFIDAVSGGITNLPEHYTYSC